MAMPTMFEATGIGPLDELLGAVEVRASAVVLF